MQGSWIDDLEDAIAAAADNLVLFIQQTLATVGPRPFGAVAGDRWTQLEAWLAVRDDPQAWQETLQAWAQEVGPAAAAVLAVREATRLEGMLLRLGRWDGTPEDAPRAALDGARAVRARLTMKRLRRATQLAGRVERLAERAPAIVLPPLPPQAADFTATTLPALLSAGTSTPQAEATQAPAPEPEPEPEPEQEEVTAS